MVTNWIRLADSCKGVVECPNISLTDRGTLAVQGYSLDIETPTGEAVVEIPASLLLEAANAFR